MRSQTILITASTGVDRIAPQTPHIQYQKMTPSMTSAGFTVNRAASSVGVTVSPYIQTPAVFARGFCNSATAWLKRITCSQLVTSSPLNFWCIVSRVATEQTHSPGHHVSLQVL